jgi:hypothetical protein
MSRQASRPTSSTPPDYAQYPDTGRLSRSVSTRFSSSGPSSSPHLAPAMFPSNSSSSFADFCSSLTSDQLKAFGNMAHIDLLARNAALEAEVRTVQCVAVRSSIRILKDIHRRNFNQLLERLGQGGASSTSAPVVVADGPDTVKSLPDPPVPLSNIVRPPRPTLARNKTVLWTLKEFTAMYPSKLKCTAYLRDEHGNVIPPVILAPVGHYIRSLLIVLAQARRLPVTWKFCDQPSWQWIRAMVYGQYPFFMLCENDYKLHKWITDNFSKWRSSYSESLTKAVRKQVKQEEDDAAGVNLGLEADDDDEDGEVSEDEAEDGQAQEGSEEGDEDQEEGSVDGEMQENALIQSDVPFEVADAPAESGTSSFAISSNMELICL